MGSWLGGGSSGVVERRRGRGRRGSGVGRVNGGGFRKWGGWTAPALRGVPRSAALVELLDAVELGSVRAVWIALTADGGARLVKRKVSSWGR